MQWFFFPRLLDMSGSQLDTFEEYAGKRSAFQNKRVHSSWAYKGRPYQRIEIRMLACTNSNAEGT